MQTKNGFTLMSVDEFETWLSKQKITRTIKIIQLHHTWSPNYSSWKKNKDHFKVQQGMKNAHLNRGFNDIAQNFTIFPDGMIMTGRSLNTAPAGIKGANANGICIENVGNFDKGQDVMTDEQSGAIIAVTAVLLKEYKLTVEDITYHAWWTADGGYLGNYIAGKSAKTCPGTDFFGGNTKTAFKKNLKSKIENYGKDDFDMSLLKDLTDKYGETAVKDALESVIESRQEEQWKNDGSDYLHSACELSDVHNQGEPITFGILGTILSKLKG